jgi:hypothetical protein
MKGDIVENEIIENKPLKQLKVVIAGSRYDKSHKIYANYKFVEENILRIMKENYPDCVFGEIVSGHAIGIDRLGEKFGSEYRIKIKQFIPNWRELGKSAGFKRNMEMANYGDILIAFTTGSNGTKDMIENMKRLEKPYHIIRIE